MGRGGTVDQAALIDALRDGRIAGAALDVFEEEPLAADSPLWRMPNVIVSPHVCGDFDGWERVVVDLFVENLGRFVNAMAANLKRQQEELVDKERLEADIEVARSIQERLLPQCSPVVAGADVAGVSIPSRVVGGDLFYFLPFGEGRLGLAVGDVSGKSVPAALLMSNVLAVLRAEAQIGVAVDESLSRINHLIAEQIEPNRFVSLFYGVVDRPADTLLYASAGHNPPLILRADGSIAWLREGGTPLGVVADARYGAATERFARGDVLVLYTDGVTEAESGTTDEFFGTSRLVDAVAGARGGSAAEIVVAVLDALQKNGTLLRNGSHFQDSESRISKRPRYGRG